MDDAIVDNILRLAAALGPRTRGLGELLRNDADPCALLAGDPTLLAQLPSSTAAALGASAGAQNTPQTSLEQLRTQLRACGAEFLPIGAAGYPQALREIPDPPPWLFCRGDTAKLGAPMVAIVGSRRASHAGLKLAGALASRLAILGYRICSGLALGIDGAAHRGALSSGTTVAVLGTGIDSCYPRQHLDLARQVVDEGCLVSEFPPGTAVHKGQFPRRNRVISGLSQATIIVEAALPSGSLHTAAAALEQGRDVFVLPWSVLHSGGAGCLFLLRDGATPITSLDELDEHFPTLEAVGADTSEPEQRLLDIIGDGSPGLSALQTATGLASTELMALLGRLEVEGRVRRDSGGYSLA